MERQGTGLHVIHFAKVDLYDPFRYSPRSRTINLAYLLATFGKKSIIQYGWLPAASAAAAAAAAGNKNPDKK